MKKKKMMKKASALIFDEKDETHEVTLLERDHERETRTRNINMITRNNAKVEVFPHILEKKNMWFVDIACSSVHLVLHLAQ